MVGGGGVLAKKIFVKRQKDNAFFINLQLCNTAQNNSNDGNDDTEEEIEGAC